MGELRAKLLTERQDMQQGDETGPHADSEPDTEMQGVEQGDSSSEAASKDLAKDIAVSYVHMLTSRSVRQTVVSGCSMNASQCDRMHVCMCEGVGSLRLCGRRAE